MKKTLLEKIQMEKNFVYEEKSGKEILKKNQTKKISDKTNSDKESSNKENF